MTGDGMTEFFEAVEASREEYEMYVFPRIFLFQHIYKFL